MYTVLAIITGGFFGFSLYITGASMPKKLISMLRLQNLTLMKTILFAIGSASVHLAITAIFGWFQLSHLSIKAVNLGVIIGGLIFGIGFGSVGTCPGTCVAASASGGLKKAVAAIAGGLFGAFAFTLSYKGLKNIGLFDTMNLGKLTLFRISDEYDSVLNIGYPGLLIMGLLFVAASLLLPEKLRSDHDA
ncbi:MAG: YeeE/YedE thiosulfate transporter family protein [Oscillospiraceae bacterium]|nr:YeeE/YedE thiosulfate transporter family protein [Oscillospiraceae bacterium]